MNAFSFDFQQFCAREQIVTEPGGLKHRSEFGHLAKNFRLEIGFKYIFPQFWENDVSFQLISSYWNSATHFEYKFFSWWKSRYLKEAERSKADAHSYSEGILPDFDLFSSGWRKLHLGCLFAGGG